MEEAEGWLKVVVSPAAILKVPQLMKALGELWLMVNCEPEVLKVAEPWVTVPPVGLASSTRRNSHPNQSDNAQPGDLEAAVAEINFHCNSSVKLLEYTAGGGEI